MYYLNYEETSNINYTFLLCLYVIAKKDQKKGIANTIEYTKLQDIQQQIKDNCGITYSIPFISKELNKNSYSKYILIDKNKKSIKILNNFKSGQAVSNKFIVLNSKEVELILKEQNNLLCKYLLYIKYYCGKSIKKQSDFTAQQFLNAIGYSANSGSNKQKLSQYNTLLLDKGLIKIQRVRDNNGRQRNIYSLP